MMDMFLAIVCLMLVLALVWVYSIAREAKDETHHLWLRLEGQKQQIVEHGYCIHSLKQQAEKKGKQKWRNIK
jgi:hypothetical protein